ncbi:hypothetical protein CLOP_g10688 [Closterium sp. NIES-67]|nr:hypothetical protein CLOP_g10688 [Closterium sp. NIES-67]
MSGGGREGQERDGDDRVAVMVSRGSGGGQERKEGQQRREGQHMLLVEGSKDEEGVRMTRALKSAGGLRPPEGLRPSLPQLDLSLAMSHGQGVGLGGLHGVEEDGDGTCEHQQQHQQQQQQQFVRGGVSNSNAISEERIRDFLQEKAEGLQQLQTPLMAETEAPRQASDMPHGASGLAGSSAEAEPSCGPFEEREEANGAQVEKQAARVGDGTRRVASPSNQKQTGVGTGVGQTIPGQGQGQGQGQAPVSSRPAGLTPSPRRHRESSPARRKRILKESFALPRDLSPSARLQPQAPAAAAAAAAPAVAPAAAAPAVAFSSPSTATQSPSVSLPSPSLPSPSRRSASPSSSSSTAADPTTSLPGSRTPSANQLSPTLGQSRHHPTRALKAR